MKIFKATKLYGLSHKGIQYSLVEDGDHNYVFLSNFWYNWDCGVTYITWNQQLDSFKAEGWLIEETTPFEFVVVFGFTPQQAMLGIVSFAVSRSKGTIMIRLDEFRKELNL